MSDDKGLGGLYGCLFSALKVCEGIDDYDEFLTDDERKKYRKAQKKLEDVSESVLKRLNE